MKHAAGFFFLAALFGFFTVAQIQLIGAHWESITLAMTLFIALLLIRALRHARAALLAARAERT